MVEHSDKVLWIFRQGMNSRRFVMHSEHDRMRNALTKMPSAKHVCKQCDQSDGAPSRWYHDWKANSHQNETGNVVWRV